MVGAARAWSAARARPLACHSPCPLPARTRHASHAPTGRRQRGEERQCSCTQPGRGGWGRAAFRRRGAGSEGRDALPALACTHALRVCRRALLPACLIAGSTAFGCAHVAAAACAAGACGPPQRPSASLAYAHARMDVPMRVCMHACSTHSYKQPPHAHRSNRPAACLLTRSWDCELVVRTRQARALDTGVCSAPHPPPTTPCRPTQRPRAHKTKPTRLR